MIPITVRTLSLSLGAVFVTACGGSQPMGALTTASNSGKTLSYHHTFKYTGSVQTFRVPSGVTSIDVVARGAAGAGEMGSQYHFFGRGGRIHATIPVSPGEKLYVSVGGAGSSNIGGFNGGGNGGPSQGSSTMGYAGGGASDVREGGQRLVDRVLVVGGGAGAGYMWRGAPGIGGNGGGMVGENGGDAYFYGAKGGAGGTQSAGGSGGSGGTGPGNPGHSGKSGGFGEGGRGGAGGHSRGYYTGGGGGSAGGGYYGGGGGGGGASGVASLYGASAGGGGGGSSYVEPSASRVHMWQGWKNATGNGLVVFSWQ